MGRGRCGDSLWGLSGFGLYWWPTPASLAPALAANRGFPLPLALRAGLLVKASLPELGVEAGALHLPLETPERTLEALVVLDDYFQSRLAP